MNPYFFEILENHISRINADIDEIQEHLNAFVMVDYEDEDLGIFNGLPLMENHELDKDEMQVLQIVSSLRSRINKLPIPLRYLHNILLISKRDEGGEDNGQQ